MFFPSSSEIIKSRLTLNKHKDEIEKNPITAQVSRSFLSEKDLITKTYPYPKKTGLGDNPCFRRLKYPKPIPIPIQIVRGKKLNCSVRQFLSNYGKTTHLVRFNKGVPQDELVGFDLLSGKYLAICCFTLPMFSDTRTATYCRALIDACHELSKSEYPFELVVVANMRNDVLYDQKAAFDHFYSAFSCLAIPFSDFETRHYIHVCLRLGYGGYGFDLDLALLVDPEGIILDKLETLCHFQRYGSHWAPFLPTTFDAIQKKDKLLRCRLDRMHETVYEDCLEPLSLHSDILLCDPLFTLDRFEAETDVSHTVLDLSHKYVGLYLFIDGDIIEDIKAAHDYCLANNQQLEIVLVPMPFHDEPESHIQQLHQLLRSLKINSWFLYHCPTVVSNRLWRVFGEAGLWDGEKFIIIPPNCKSGELCGREIITYFGVDQYPFTRTAILKQKLEYIRSLTPIFSSSLFYNCHMIQNGQKFKSEQLQGKKVLLYISWTQFDCYYLMKKHYSEIKGMGWEVVVVLLDYTDRYWNEHILHIQCRCMMDSFAINKWSCFNLQEMPWPYMLASAAAGAEIKKLFFPRHADRKTAYLFAVREDGKIVSSNVKHRLKTGGVTESLFEDALERDLARRLATMPLINEIDL